jgi:hypothetical protein
MMSKLFGSLVRSTLCRDAVATDSEPAASLSFAKTGAPSWLFTIATSQELIASDDRDRWHGEHSDGMCVRPHVWCCHAATAFAFDRGFTLAGFRLFQS